MFLNSIIMSYKENCKVEGEILTKFKIARMYFFGKIKQKEIAKHLSCHNNTVNKIVISCKNHDDLRIWDYLSGDKSMSGKELYDLFGFLRYESRKPQSNKRSIPQNSKSERLILEQFTSNRCGAKRMFIHLKRQGFDSKIFSIGKIKGVYKKHKLKVRRIRTANRERRQLYDYDALSAFECLQYDVKVLADKHALPKDIYDKFKHSKELPRYQWTIIDAKTKTRFLAYSYEISSFFGLEFLKFTLNWIRSHGVQTKINVQVDMGSEFYSGSKRKQAVWNESLSALNASVSDTEGAKWKQNIVERSHRTDDEEFLCPRGKFINSKSNFMVESQFWVLYFNNRSHSGIGMDGLSPKEKLTKCGVLNAEKIINFPCLILDDFIKPFLNSSKQTQNIFHKKSHYVLTYYLLLQ